jgi:hypothetical protein
MQAEAAEKMDELLTPIDIGPEIDTLAHSHSND